MPSFLDILAPSRIPDTRGVERRRGPADPDTRVRFDLQALLNATRPPDSLTAGYAELPASVVNYGVKDFAFAVMNDAGDRAKLAQHIAEVIAAFEPRLADVRVEPRDPDDVSPGGRKTALHFRISARLADPDGDGDAAFDNVFEWTTGRHDVKPR